MKAGKRFLLGMLFQLARLISPGQFEVVDGIAVNLAERGMVLYALIAAVIKPLSESR